MSVNKYILPALLYFCTFFVYPLVLLLCWLHVAVKRLFFQPDPRSIRNEVAVVTGGGGGLGRALCGELARHGCHLAVVDINQRSAEQVAFDMRKKHNVKAKAYQVDVTDHAAVEQLAKDVSTDLGDATLLFNNAGLMLFNDMLKPDWRDVQSMINVNLTAHFWLNDVFLPKMKEKKRGYIVATSSLAGLFSILEIPVYCATKFGVKALMRSLRLNLQCEGYDDIHACTVFPYFLLTSPSVIEFIHNIGISTLYPAVDAPAAAARIVKGVLRHESDIVIPEFFGLLYRLAELLPSLWRERLTTWVTKSFTNRFSKVYNSKHQQQ